MLGDVRIWSARRLRQLDAARAAVDEGLLDIWSICTCETWPPEWATRCDQKKAAAAARDLLRAAACFAKVTASLYNNQKEFN